MWDFTLHFGDLRHPSLVYIAVCHFIYIPANVYGPSKDALTNQQSPKTGFLRCLSRNSPSRTCPVKPPRSPRGTNQSPFLSNPDEIICSFGPHPPTINSPLLLICAFRFPRTPCFEYMCNTPCNSNFRPRRRAVYNRQWIHAYSLSLSSFWISREGTRPCTIGGSCIDGSVSTSTTYLQGEEFVRRRIIGAACSKYKN